MINDSVYWWCLIQCYHSVGRVPLAIRFAYGFPRLYQFVYPIPVRSVSVRGRLLVSFGLFVFWFPVSVSVSFMVSLFSASFGVLWSFPRVLLPLLFMHCSIVICFFLFLGRSSCLYSCLFSCFLRFCFPSGILSSCFRVSSLGLL